MSEQATNTKCIDPEGQKNWEKCPNLEMTFSSMSGERYRCETCGESFWIDYSEIS